MLCHIYGFKLNGKLTVISLPIELGGHYMQKYCLINYIQTDLIICCPHAFRLDSHIDLGSRGSLTYGIS